jgi:poly(3-hydroxybutyrate) depolymerase
MATGEDDLRSTWAVVSLAALVVCCVGCLPSGNQASRCSGYLGCSSETVGVFPDAGVAFEAGPPPGPIGTGCGKPLPTDQPMTVPGTPMGYKQYAVMGTGASLAGPQPAKIGARTFWVRVPQNYDPNHPYHVVYLGQGCGGYGVANTQTMHLYDESMGGDEQAIYVALDIPRDMANMDCYDDYTNLPASQEWEAFALFQTVVDQTYCVDNDRVDVVGYDFGGSLADIWGCYFAGDGAKPASDPTRPRVFAPQYHVRALASVAGYGADDGPPCNGPVAGIWIHDPMDGAPLVAEEAARDSALRTNGCVGSPTTPWHPELPMMDGCLQYTACPQAHPVVFCTTTGQGHADQHARAIPAFTLFFKEIATN